MTHVPYLVAGYGITAVVLAGYSWSVLRRSRALVRARPTPESPGERRWS